MLQPPLLPQRPFDLPPLYFGVLFHVVKEIVGESEARLMRGDPPSLSVVNGMYGMYAFATLVRSICTYVRAVVPEYMCMYIHIQIHGSVIHKYLWYR